MADSESPPQRKIHCEAPVNFADSTSPVATRKHHSAKKVVHLARSLNVMETGSSSLFRRSQMRFHGEDGRGTSLTKRSEVFDVVQALSVDRHALAGDSHAWTPCLMTDNDRKNLRRYDGGKNTCLKMETFLIVYRCMLYDDKAVYTGLPEEKKIRKKVRCFVPLCF